jgi:hypothetical protein
MRREDNHQSAQQADEIVVIEIRRLVDQLDVREADEEERHARTVMEAEHNADGEDDERREVQMHERSRERQHPWKQRPREVVLGQDVELVDPAKGDESNHARGHQQAEEDPERRQRCAIDGGVDEPPSHVAVARGLQPPRRYRGAG